MRAVCDRDDVRDRQGGCVDDDAGDGGGQHRGTMRGSLRGVKGRRDSVPEVAHSREDHGGAGRIGDRDDIRVTNRSAGLDEGR